MKFLYEEFSQSCCIWKARYGDKLFDGTIVFFFTFRLGFWIIDAFISAITRSDIGEIQKVGEEKMSERM